MIEFCACLGWGVVVLISFASLGQLLVRVTSPGLGHDPSLAAGWGMAGMTVIGGVLNLMGVATASVLVILVLAVIFINLVCARLGRWSAPEYDEARYSHQASLFAGIRGNREGQIWISALVLLVTAKYVSSFGLVGNLWDDKPSYLYETVRMIRTGSIGLNPFSQRQMLSLNGQQFLLGLLLSVTPEKFGYLLDPGICWIMIAAFTWHMVRTDLQGSIKIACVLTASVLMVDAPPVLNLGGYLTGTVLSLTLIRTVQLGSRAAGTLDRGTMLLVALSFAGLCAVKMTFLVFAGLFFGSWFVLRMLHSPDVRRVREAVSIGFMGSVLLVPWMYQQYLSCGTPLYPFLGRGTHLALPGFDIFTIPLWTRLKIVIDFLCRSETTPLVVALAVLAMLPIKKDMGRWHAWLAGLFAALTAALITVYQIAVLHQGAYLRYCLPTIYAALIPVGLWGFFRPRNSGLGLALCLALFVGHNWTNFWLSLTQTKSHLEGRWVSNLETAEARRKEVGDAQATIPPGRRILASIINLPVLDASRNPLWNLDLPGMASPAPGIPLPADESALVDYLEGRVADLPTLRETDQLLDYLDKAGVEYLMFEPGEPDFLIGRRRFAELPSRWDRIAFTLGYLFYGQFFRLRETCPVLYDDGGLIVFDVRKASIRKSP